VNNPVDGAKQPSIQTCGLTQMTTPATAAESVRTANWRRCRDYLSDYRLTLQMKCEGLHAEQLARRSMPPTMSPLGLLRHLAEVERNWRNWITSGDPLPKLYGEGDADFDGAVAEQTVVDAAYAHLVHEQAATDATGRASESGRALRERRYRRQELLVHRIEEYARHCGHTDLLRECIDGHVGQ
jgi:uncharacterized damage-inducible protein DinB